MDCAVRDGNGDCTGGCQAPPCHPGSAKALSGTGGRGLHAGPIGEHLLGRGRAQAIAGTEEEEVGQVNRWNELPVAPSKDF